MGVLSVLELTLQVANMWELHVEIKDSATNLSHIATFEVPSRVGLICTL